jgi:hypothetical protein
MTMKKHTTSVVAILLFWLTAVYVYPQNTTAAAETAAASAKREKPISGLAWLVGGVWTADATKVAPGMLRIETRYQWSDNGSYVRFTTHFVSEKQNQKTYDGNLFWDPAKKTLAMWYMDASNSVTQGPMAIDGDRWQIWFDGNDFEGKLASLRVEVLRKSPDLYRWSLSEKQGDNWKELASLDYARKPGA